MFKIIDHNSFGKDIIMKISCLSIQCREIRSFTNVCVLHGIHLGWKVPTVKLVKKKKYDEVKLTTVYTFNEGVSIT